MSLQSLSENLRCKVKESFALEEELQQKVDREVQSVEQHDIDEYRELIIKWNENRQSQLEECMKRVKNEKRKREIADRLLELKEDEEKLSYFEEVGQISLGITRVPETKDVKEEEAEEQFVAAPTTGGKRF